MLTESLTSKKSQVTSFFRGILQLLRRKSPFDWAEKYSLLHKKAKTEMFSQVSEAATIFFALIYKMTGIYETSFSQKQW
jgi:hypothetical protein